MLTPATDNGPATAGRRPQGLAAETRRAYAADWSFFLDWCTAADRTPLPAAPATVLEFLTENPVTPAALARRVAALDHHHRTCGAPSPGQDPAVVSWLRIAAGKPAEPSSHRISTAQLLTGLEHIPTHGWPAGVAGRRDRLLLSHAGLTRTQLHSLKATDITLTDAGATEDRGIQIHLKGQDPLLLPPDCLSGAGLPAAAVCPGCICTAWARVLRLHNRDWSIRPLRDAFTKTTPISTDTPHLCTAGIPADHAWGGWVFLATDQHGYLNPYQPLSTRSLSHRRAGAKRGTLQYRTLPAPTLATDAADSLAPADGCTRSNGTGPAEHHRVTRGAPNRHAATRQRPRRPRPPRQAVRGS